LTSAELQAAQRAGGDIGKAAVLQAVAEYSLACNLPTLSARALSMMENTIELSDKAAYRVPLRLLKGRQAIICKKYDEAREELSAATEIEGNCAEAWELLGGLHYLQGNSAESKECYAQALSFTEAAGLTCSLQLYLRLGELYLHSGAAAAAKEVYLKGCATFADEPVASLWLGVGITCLRLEEWDGAEQCLAEANILNNHNEKVWGYLALLCMTVEPRLSRRQSEADQALEQALRNGLQLPGLLRELGNAYVAADKLEVAEKLFRRSLAAQDSPMTRKRLADVLSAQNSAEAALTQYQRVLDSTEDGTERILLYEKCAQLLGTLGRSEEAGKYLAMCEAQSNLLTSQ